MPIPSGSLFSTSKELVNVPVQLLYSRRKLFEKIIANVAKRKLENHVQATGDRMSMTPQQFGMNIAHQTKKSFMVGGTLGALGGLATSKKNKRGLGAGRGALIGGGTELGVYPGAALGGLGGLALGGLISALARRNGAQMGDMLTGGALGAGAGALGGGYLGNIASRALLDDSSHSKQDEKKKKEETKEAFGIIGDPMMNANSAARGERKLNPIEAAVLRAAGHGNSIGADGKVMRGAPGSRPTDIMALNSGLERVLNNGKAIAAGNGGVAGPRPGAPMNIPGQVKNTLSMFGVNQRPAKPSLLGTASDVAEQVTGGSPTLSTMPQQPKFLGGGVAGR